MLTSNLTLMNHDLVTYSYNYPHKSSYTRFMTPIDIADIWKAEDTSNLALYLHLPFCEMRCGFCNLFTLAQPAEHLVQEYLQTLKRQMEVITRKLPELHFSRCAIGGGTPTFLQAAELDTVLTQLQDFTNISFHQLPTSIETSPATVTHDRMRVLKDFGIHRISIGIQSFKESQTNLLGRPQMKHAVFQALDIIKQYAFPELNIDLIYGMPEQSLADWQYSITQTLSYQPAEVYLYPLYIRPQTGLSRTHLETAEFNTHFYTFAREQFLQAGYTQMSLRNFRRAEKMEKTNYSCQRDGMVGLGCGARSYTHHLHYANRFAVTKSGISLILKDWINQTDNELGLATHGIILDQEEQFRRYVILTLLQSNGLSLNACNSIFPDHDLLAWPETKFLLEHRLIILHQNHLLLTQKGMMLSDSIGPLFYSVKVKEALVRFIDLTKNTNDLINP